MIKLLYKIIGYFRPYTKAIQFSGTPSGDMECFCWDKVKEIVDDGDRLYPDRVMDILGCVPGKMYVFTITTEELE